MAIENHIRGRRRLLDEAKKARLCELVAQEGYSVEQAADSLDVSLRTVQRERRYDQDFRPRSKTGPPAARRSLES